MAGAPPDRPAAGATPRPARWNRPALAGLLASLLLCAAGVLALAAGRGGARAWLVVVFFAACAACLAASLRGRRTAGVSPAAVSRVAFDDRGITLRDAFGNTRSLAWAGLVEVAIVTTDDGPLGEDLYWDLHGAGDERLCWPGGAPGALELLGAMQVRLPGFDDATVIAAMASTRLARFVVWRRPAAGADAATGRDRRSGRRRRAEP